MFDFNFNVGFVSSPGLCFACLVFVWGLLISLSKKVYYDSGIYIYIIYTYLFVICVFVHLCFDSWGCGLLFLILLHDCFMTDGASCVCPILFLTICYDLLNDSNILNATLK